MRAITQLIEHLYGYRHLTESQVAEFERMGLIRRESRPQTAFAETDCCENDGDTDELSRIDTWDAHGDRLAEQARPRSRGTGKGGPRRSTQPSPDFIRILERAVAAADELLTLVFEIARRLNPAVDRSQAVRTVNAAGAADLDAVLIRDDLWARLWPHIRSEPILSDLTKVTWDGYVVTVNLRRFLAVVGGNRCGTPVARGMIANPVVRQAVDIWQVHRALTAAFGRVACRIDPSRSLRELNLAGDPDADAVMAVLLGARGSWRTAIEFPVLESAAWPPNLRRLPSWPYDDRRLSAAWEIAARIDPLNVLPFLNWRLRV